MFDYKLNLLVAYPYMQKSMISFLNENQDKIRFLLDSGAFTAHKSGNPIKLDDYCRFLERLPFAPWKYFTLDVIGDPVATMKNYETMLARGFTPIPIFTIGACIDSFEEYFKTSDIVGVGGINQARDPVGFSRAMLKKANGRKVHLLGFTRFEFLKTYKPHMCDSSSWEQAARYGSTRLFMGGGKPLLCVTKEKIKTALKSPDVLSAFKRIKIDPFDLLQDQQWCGGISASRKTCARSARLLSEGFFKNCGVNYFLAATTKNAVEILLGE